MSPSDVPATSGFSALGLDDKIVRELTALGYEEPTPIQREAIPPLLQGRDLLGQAATGTGKTAAFALPLLQLIHEAGEVRHKHTSALILTPTRELAVQVAEAIHKYGRSLGITVLPIYGGADMRQQLRALSRGVDVVVATPGRALDHIRRKSLKLDQVRTVVLDEADEMLDMGFAEDLEAILNEAPAKRQTALFSATMAQKVGAVANRHLKDPVRLTIARDTVKAGTMPKVRQIAYIVPRAHKTATLGRVLDMESPTSAIVFCRTRTEVDELTEALSARGYQAGALHGGMSQEQRDRIMKKFRANTMDLLIATDVAARGLDVEHLSHVVNYNVPTSPEAYIHRIGRTGRAGREGIAVTLAEPREHGYLRNIERLTKQKIEMATIPTVADLRARRLELTRTSLQEILLEGNLNSFRVVVESLADGEFDIMDVAAAAVKAAHEAMGNADEKDTEIPVVFDAGGSGKGKRDKRDKRGKSGDFDAGEFDPKQVGRKTKSKSGASEGKWAERTPFTNDRAGRKDTGKKGANAKGDGQPREPRESAKFVRTQPEWEVSRLYVGAGRTAKIRPGDIVGAIANEVGIEASVVGAIEIYDKYSLVEVPEEIADDIIDALQGTTIKGKRIPVRRDKA